jgi:hypothetical protein
MPAMADRFGGWFPAGTNNVACGDYDAHTQYARVIGPWFRALRDIPAGVPPLARILLRAGLLRGVTLRWTALRSGPTLVMFAVSLVFFSGFEMSPGPSRFSLLAPPPLLTLCPPGSEVVSIKPLRRFRRAKQKAVK